MRQLQKERNDQRRELEEKEYQTNMIRQNLEEVTKTLKNKEVKLKIQNHKLMEVKRNIKNGEKDLDKLEKYEQGEGDDSVYQNKVI